MRKFLVALLLTASYVGCYAQEWNTSIGVTLHDRHGSVSIGTNNYPQYQQPQANVYVYPQYVPQQQVIVVPCYNCGQYPVPVYNNDPYRNHRHLQRGPSHGHYHGNQPSVNINIHN
jgi:hypothetical protein